jgi:hypothetical protein
MRSTDAHFPEAGHLHPRHHFHALIFKRSTNERRARVSARSPVADSPSAHLSPCARSRCGGACPTLRGPQSTSSRGAGRPRGTGPASNRASGHDARRQGAETVARNGPCPLRGVRDRASAQSTGCRRGAGRAHAFNPTMGGLGAVTPAARLRRPAAAGLRDSKAVHQLATNALSCCGSKASPRERPRASGARRIPLARRREVPSPLASRRSPGGRCRAAHGEREKDDRNAPATAHLWCAPYPVSRSWTPSPQCINRNRMGTCVPYRFGWI